MTGRLRTSRRCSTIWSHAGETSSTACSKPLSRNIGSLTKGLKLAPGHLGIELAVSSKGAETAIRAGDYTISTYHIDVTPDALCN